MAKKKSAKSKVSASMFKTTGAHAKMKIDQKKKKMFYFKEKVKPEKAKRSALKDGADVLGVSSSAVKVGKPALKYDFYCIYDAILMLKFLRLRKQELGVNDQVSGAFVGKEVILPKKGKTIPGKSLHLEVVELFELKRSDGMTVDGKTGGPADALERLLKGPGKKKATPAWVRKNKVSPGKYNSVEKVVKTVAKLARQKPSDAKRVIQHSLTFKKLDGFYMPVYYVKVTAGAKTQTLRINGINGAVSLAV
ncbi:MAG: hypothetical protein ACXADF_02970 [Candidatus Thorarchaeota archaeon]